MAYNAEKLTKLAALKQLAQKIESDFATKSAVNALGLRIDGLVNSGGQANVLEGIKVNGSLLTLTGKIADILIAESTTNGAIKVNSVDVAVHGLAALAYKSQISESDLASALKASINAKASQSALDTLTGTGTGSISQMIATAINDFSTKVTDDGVVNSYKELIDWVATHGAAATQMAAGIATNAQSINGLKSLVGTLPEGATATTVVGYITEAITALSIGDYSKTTEVTAAINTALADYYKKTETYSKTELDSKFAGYVPTTNIATDAEVTEMLNDVFGK